MARTILAAGTAAATSTAFAMAGVGKLIADPLVDSEYVKLQEELPNGTYIDVVNENGIGIVLTKGQQSRLFEGYGNYKAVKSVTASSVGVELEE